MARNVEIKARVADLEPLAEKVAALADRGPVELVQDDTFFGCRTGRLKLRVLGDGSAELIFYRRSDRPGPKESVFERVSVEAPDRLREVLSLAYGGAGRVRKQRTVYHVGRTRVHLDRVEGLGDFLELEVVLGEGESAEAGMSVARSLMVELGVAESDLVAGAYRDALAEGRAGPA